VLWSGADEPEQALGSALAAAGVDGAATREVAPDMETVFAYLAGPVAELAEAPSSGSAES